MAHDDLLSGQVVLCVDLDGTLIHTDLLYESLLALLRQSPLNFLRVPFWLLRGRAHLKQQIAARVQPDVQHLPYNRALLDQLAQERAAGRRLALVTGSPMAFAQAVAAHLGIFDEVLATDDQINLTGRRKAEKLVQRYGARGYDYAGDSVQDLPVWAGAREGWAVNVRPRVLRAASTHTRFAHRIDAPPTSPLAYVRALRLHQWLKNVLVFVPLLAAHRSGDPELLLKAVLMFVAFGLCASSGYVLNDLLDLAADRAHPRKRRRPFASGTLRVVHGVIVIPLLLAAALGLAWWRIGVMAVAALLIYYVMTLAYSLVLKRLTTVDVLTLAGLYTLRILAGSAATLIAPSFWLLAFSMFLFLSLAVIKRYSEVLMVHAQGEGRLRGRAYSTEDRVILPMMGISSGFMSVLVLALYVHTAPVRELYRQPQMISLLCPLLLYWICRAWFKAHRGEMHDDPLVFATTDPVSWAVAGLSVAVLLLAA